MNSSLFLTAKKSVKNTIVNCKTITGRFSKISEKEFINEFVIFVIKVCKAEPISEENSFEARYGKTCFNKAVKSVCWDER